MYTKNSAAGKSIHLSRVSFRGVVSAYPKFEVRNIDFHKQFPLGAINEIAKLTGVQTRRVASADQTASDLSFEAALKLLNELNWDTQTIDGLIFVSQTPDFKLPATACSLQRRLGLGIHCVAFDVNLGCSGYVYGLWLASKLIDGDSVKRVLLLAGDTSSKLVNSLDRSTALLFGDAGSATALEFEPSAGRSFYVLGTDGRGEDNLKTPRNLYRSYQSEQKSVEEVEGNYLYMNGPEVFNFTIRSVPLMIKSLLQDSGQTIETIDYILFHQANEFMLKHIARKLKLPLDKVPMNIQRFGNTSSASIPLLMTTVETQNLASSNVVIAGFGVGYSWAAAFLSLGGMQVCQWVEV